MDERIDRLYELLPTIHRIRDAEQGYPLKALLRVIAEQVNVVEDDIAQLYDNWFIETAQDWAVPYVGDLIGYRPVHEAGEPGDVTTAQSRARNKILFPRREVAKTIYYRRRKGALALLELLARDVAGWPARAVEFFRLLGWLQHINHIHTEGIRSRTADLRNGEALDLLNGPFDQVAHTAELRRIDSANQPGRYNIPNVGLFVWRLRSYSITRTPAYCLEESGPHCYTFSILGQDAPLFVKPQPEPTPTHIAEEMNLPAPIRRRAFEQHLEYFYGEGKSLAIWAGDWAAHSPSEPLPARVIIPADLSDWHYEPPPNFVAVDPARGRIAFPPSQLPRRNVRVSAYYGFSADIGGGEYERPLFQPIDYMLYRVGENEPFKRIGEALEQWEHENPRDAVIEIADSNVYVDPISIALAENHSLQLRAANHTRPIIRLIDWQADLPDALRVDMARGSRLTLDGLLITGRPVHIRHPEPAKDERHSNEVCPAEVNIRHCTVVPGWSLHNNCEPKRPAEPSLELSNVRARVSIEHSILGSIQVHADAVRSDPIPLHITDSIIDAMSSTSEAVGAPGYPVAHVLLTIQRCTVFGSVEIHAMALAENCIFSSCVTVARRQLGCMRFCYILPECRTPRRYHCQPERAVAEKQGQLKGSPTEAELEAVEARERQRVAPRFNGVRYGQPAYCQLVETCADEIKRGADDESEMGVFHDLFQPQRAANLRARLAEYLPASVQAAVIFAN